MKISEGQLEVIKAGFYSSIQDLGRYGYGQWGIPVSGAMDQQSFALANHLLGNQPRDACLEMTLIGGHFLFHSPTFIVITGAQGAITLNGLPCSINKRIQIKAGDRLKVSTLTRGCRSYLGIKGGFQLAEILNSKSWYPGITPSLRLAQGMVLPYLVHDLPLTDRHSKVALDEGLFDDHELEVYPGPEAEKLSEAQYQTLFSTPFTLSARQDRMGILMEEHLDNELEEILTAPVYPGTVQLTPGGKIMVLMRDAQVTGGYPRILMLTQAAISKLSQKKQGEKIHFKLAAD